ncbi:MULTISPECIES: sigma-54-dependent transcriptional regulator [Brevibacillus]|uniref:Two-component response regulator n=1 Tax=Brevibacillus borstelensis AK1 TaxID=1300222 RepID=M8E4I3_9BACL|nr:sigma-54 dependent transcriptional regulator [Brevibacillus borstelensis]EMT50385.1 two-component response regulator [Brevibacillus borstelensis AK1]MCC0563926.1 sigma-54 dependent transcriptional regulator [Brevibacillus borstelensis]MCM3469959.1 sigma-54 dependent transcriptional regulator [Brevibacillus borstelensis]MCM3558390.1 sigma-54 dependent transcriptional regulator [Brevibacillus borstelensis]MCM3590327.1 sigma-54 dependent transcriptional regulator [Brevibacillus borstelensis]
MNRKNVLIIDDEVEVTSFFTYFLKAKNCHVTVAHSGKEVELLLADNASAGYQLALIDLKLPDANGLELLTAIKNRFPACEAMVMTGYSTIKSAVTAMQLGARDYLEKPFDDLDSLETAIFSVLEKSTERYDRLAQTARHYGMVYAPASPMVKVLSLAEKLAKKAINILIEGETGTGKELMARFLHGTSTRSSFPFVGINCGAIPETLLESELFGHEKGAFTGAVKARKGFFELAHNGTLFLDEIGEAPLSIQVKLLRVIETGEFMRIGGEQTLKSNIRFISATNRSLEQEVEKNGYRADLLYRLEGVKLSIPPLRERPDDIPFIVQDYLEKKFGGTRRVDAEAMALLTAYHWPGNVRQLLNVMNQTAAIHDCPVLLPEHLPANIVESSPRSLANTNGPLAVHRFVEQEAIRFVESVVDRIGSVDEIHFEQLMERIRRLETEIGRHIILKGLKETDGNRQLLSEKLGISKRTLRYILNEKE